MNRPAPHRSQGTLLHPLVSFRVEQRRLRDPPVRLPAAPACLSPARQQSLSALYVRLLVARVGLLAREPSKFRALPKIPKRRPTHAVRARAPAAPLTGGKCASSCRTAKQISSSAQTPQPSNRRQVQQLFRATR